LKDDKTELKLEHITKITDSFQNRNNSNYVVTDNAFFKAFSSSTLPAWTVSQLAQATAQAIHFMQELLTYLLIV
jgi:hypothetical protein